MMLIHHLLMSFALSFVKEQVFISFSVYRMQCRWILFYTAFAYFQGRSADFHEKPQDDAIIIRDYRIRWRSYDIISQVYGVRRQDDRRRLKDYSIRSRSYRIRCSSSFRRWTSYCISTASENKLNGVRRIESYFFFVTFLLVAFFLAGLTGFSFLS